MRIKIPRNLHAGSCEEVVAAYRRGWRDALAASARKAGSTTSEAKAAAARANGAKGGRPRKKRPKDFFSKWEKVIKEIPL